MSDITKYTIFLLAFSKREGELFGDQVFRRRTVKFWCVGMISFGVFISSVAQANPVVRYYGNSRSDTPPDIDCGRIESERDTFGRIAVVGCTETTQPFGDVQRDGQIFSARTQTVFAWKRRVYDSVGNVVDEIDQVYSYLTFNEVNTGPAYSPEEKAYFADVARTYYDVGGALEKVANALFGAGLFAPQLALGGVVTGIGSAGFYDASSGYAKKALDPPDYDYWEIPTYTTIFSDLRGANEIANQFFLGFQGAMSRFGESALNGIVSYEKMLGAIEDEQFNALLPLIDAYFMFEGDLEQAQHDAGVWLQALPDFLTELGIADFALTNLDELDFSDLSALGYETDGLTFFSLLTLMGDDLKIDGYDDPIIASFEGAAADAVPIPGTAVLFVTGLFGIARWKKWARAK